MTWIRRTRTPSGSYCRRNVQDSNESWDAAGIESARKRAEARAAEAEKLRASLDEINAERAEQQAEEEHERLRQFVQDKRRQKELEQQHGFNRVLAVPFSSWKPAVGAATMLVVVLPDARSNTYQRLQRAGIRHKEAGEAERIVDDVESLARACIRYPNPNDPAEKPMYLATVNLAPGILANLAKQIGDAVAGREAAAKKG